MIFLKKKERINQLQRNRLLFKKLLKLIYIFINRYFIYLYIGIRITISKYIFNNTFVIRIELNNTILITVGYQNNTDKHNSDNPE